MDAKAELLVSHKDKRLCPRIFTVHSRKERYGAWHFSGWDSQLWLRAPVSLWSGCFVVRQRNRLLFLALEMSFNKPQMLVNAAGDFSQNVRSICVTKLCAFIDTFTDNLA